MSRSNPTPEELDRMSDALLPNPKCDQCGERPGSFTKLVDHIKVAHPNGGSHKSA